MRALETIHDRRGKLKRDEVRATSTQHTVRPTHAIHMRAYERGSAPHAHRAM